MKSSDTAKLPSALQSTVQFEWPGARHIKDRVQRRELEAIALAYRSGEINRPEFEARIGRWRGKAMLKDGPLLRPFPTDPAEITEWAVHRSLRAKGEPSKADHRTRQGEHGFRYWCNAVEDRMYAITEVVRIVARWASCDEDWRLVDRLLQQGDRMAAFYQSGLRSESIPWMPHYRGFPNVVAAYEHWRAAMVQQYSGQIAPQSFDQRDDVQQGMGL